MKKTIIISLILSILHSILFYGQDWGVSIVLFMIPTILLLILLLKKNDKIKNKKALYLSIPIILLSCTYFIFNNEYFNFLNIVIIPILVGVMTVWATTDIFKIRFLISKSVNLVAGSLEFIPNAIKLIKCNIKSNKEENKEIKRNTLKLVGIGLLCSLPILLIILALLISADGVFAQLFGKIIYWFSSEMIISLLLRLIIIAIMLIYIICVIYNLTNKESAYNKILNKESKIKLNINEIIINTILTAINVVYLVFSSIQFLYVFSYIYGNVPLATNFDFARYARQGFFQLMIVSLINFVIIIITNFNIKQMTSKVRNYTKVMNILMALLTAIIAVSAFMRMNLYQREYGYTFLRLVVYFILATEVIMIIPTIVYILKEKINLFKHYFIIAITMYVILNFINVDYIIARNNVDKYIKETNTEEKKIDFTYLKKYTSTDAIPALIDLLNNTQDDTLKRKVNNYLYDEYNDLKEKRNIQEFNISKERAEKMLEGLNLKYEKYTIKKRINKKINRSLI